MFFLKDKSKEIKKKNIIFVENFLDTVTKKELKSKGFKYEAFKVHDNKTKLSKDIKKTQYIYHKYIKRIRHKIEKLYKIKANEKIINLIFSKWLFYYISSSFYKYKILLNIKKKYPKFALIDIVDRNLNEEDKLLYAPDSTILSFKLFKDVGINLNIKVIKVKFDEIKNLIIFIPSLKDKKNRFSISFFLKFLISTITLTISKFFYTNSIQIHDDTLNFYNILKIIIKSKFKFSYLFFVEKYPPLNQEINFDESIVNFDSNDNFEKILNNNFLFYLPKSIIILVNYFLINYSNKKDIKSKNIIVSKRFFAAGYLNFKKFLIKNFNKDTLISYQHGGTYGQEINYFPEKIERLITDRFATWGWKGKKTLILPSENYKKNREVKNQCLFVTISSTYAFLNYSDIPEKIPNVQMEPSLQLLKKVTKKIPTLLRLPPYRHRWRDKEYFEQVKNLKFDDHKKNFKYMASTSKFVIHNHFNSTALETLSMNIPTLIFCDKALIEYNTQANKFLKKLINAKIFFYRYQDVSKFLESHNYNLDKWWLSKKVQEVRKLFCKNYCHTSLNWSQDWIFKLNTLQR